MEWSTPDTQVEYFHNNKTSTNIYRENTNEIVYFEAVSKSSLALYTEK
jgi:hypothetical protein